jgi:hypothetical protein
MRKNYANMPVGKFWWEVASLVIEGMAVGGETAFPRSAPDGADPIGNVMHPKS